MVAGEKSYDVLRWTALSIITADRRNLFNDFGSYLLVHFVWVVTTKMQITIEVQNYVQRHFPRKREAPPPPRAEAPPPRQSKQACGCINCKQFVSIDNVMIKQLCSQTKRRRHWHETSNQETAFLKVMPDGIKSCCSSSHQSVTAHRTC